MFVRLLSKIIPRSYEGGPSGLAWGDASSENQYHDFIQKAKPDLSAAKRASIVLEYLEEEKAIRARAESDIRRLRPNWNDHQVREDVDRAVKHEMEELLAWKLTDIALETAKKYGINSREFGTLREQFIDVEKFQHIFTFVVREIRHGPNRPGSDSWQR